MMTNACFLSLVALLLSNYSSWAYVSPGLHSRTSSIVGSRVVPSHNFEPRKALTKPKEPAFALKMSTSGENEGNESLRTRLRNLTGFSFTALRATLRATTGISLTAVRVAVGATTSKFVTNTMTFVVGIFPTWFRYFLQPILVLYYTPLMIIRSMVGPTATFWKDERAAHEAFVEGWKKAVDAAEEAQKGGYWPVHVDKETGAIEAEPDANVVEGVAESIEVAMSED